MRFLLDMNVGQSLGELLVRKGHIVEYVRNRDPRMPDDQVLEWATKEKLIIITTDKNFETMIWREGRKHFGLVRLENLPRIERNALIEYVLKLHSNALIEGAIVIAQSHKFRIRRTNL